MNGSEFSVNLPIQVGLVGTGYAAKLRAETFSADRRTNLVAVAGYTPEKLQEFSQTYGIEPFNFWMEMLERVPLDLVAIANVNREHGAIVRAALEADKHVIVEYPLSLDLAEARELLTLAIARNRLLHVEHIELLGGMHQALIAHLPAVGTVFYVRYATINPQRPAPRKWTFHHDLFGFPFMGALSRVHRLTDAFGAVEAVHCQARFWDAVGEGKPGPYYTTCLCTAHLRFKTGLVAELTYGKGENLWHPERRLEVHGEAGALVFDGDEGRLVLPEESRAIEVGARRGLFAKDTANVLDHLVLGTPLYVTPAASLYAMQVADAARRSAETGQTIVLD
jgi:biliverdin reductase